MKYFALLAFGVFVLNVGHGVEGGLSLPVTVKPKQPGSCGIVQADVMVQKVTQPMGYPTGLFWQEQGITKHLFYVDKATATIYAYGQAGQLNSIKLSEGGQVVSIHPIKNANSRSFIVAIDQSLYILNLTSIGFQNYAAKQLMTVVQKPNILVKGKTDKNGRLWFTVYNTTGGSLLKIDTRNNVVVMETGLKNPKGFSWCKDNKLFYLIDSDMKVIYEYDYNLDAGAISNKRIVFQADTFFPTGGVPTDITLDLEGYLWIAMSDIGQVIKFDVKSGEVVQRISLPATQITSLEYGLYKMKNLFVGTAKSSAISQADAGAVFGISGQGSAGVSDYEVVVPK